MPTPRESPATCDPGIAPSFRKPSRIARNWACRLPEFDSLPADVLPHPPTEILAEKSRLSLIRGCVDQVSAPQSLKTDHTSGRFSQSCVLQQTHSLQMSPWPGFLVKVKERSLILLALDFRSLKASFQGLQELSSSLTSSHFSRPKTLYHQCHPSRSPEPPPSPCTLLPLGHA